MSCLLSPYPTRKILAEADSVSSVPKPPISRVIDLSNAFPLALHLDLPAKPIMRTVPSLGSTIRPSSPDNPSQGPKMMSDYAQPDEKHFLTIIWITTGIPAIFLSARFYLRCKVDRHYRADDALVLTAWVLLVVYASIWSAIIKKRHASFPIAVDLTDLHADFHWVDKRYQYAQLGAYCIATVSLWCVKFSFAFFLRGLGERYKLQRVIWWVVFGMLLAALVGSLRSLAWKCGLSELRDFQDNCLSSTAIHNQRIDFITLTVLDVLSDVAIILLSGNVLWRVRISWSRKIALVGISLLTAFIITVSVIRLVIFLESVVSNVLMAIWTGVELSVAIIVACIASLWTLRNMFKKHRADALAAAP
ncbi:hypothetical protein BDV28DRAFT_145907 [Aspergillus coremiiformis]|uniref:Rhodopsin domain-containing protein n=1 Tax=Aspergillus coremiiformis TaxID=138285 RepID=A0A5N6ZDJ1_9EURO|nr:hypothetical protein BDV28DRAFT_145907 [Aspergillus coremiiformis]